LRGVRAGDFGKSGGEGVVRGEFESFRDEFWDVGGCGGGDHDRGFGERSGENDPRAGGAGVLFGGFGASGAYFSAFCKNGGAARAHGGGGGAGTGVRGTGGGGDLRDFEFGGRKGEFGGIAGDGAGVWGADLFAGGGFWGFVKLYKFFGWLFDEFTSF